MNDKQPRNSLNLNAEEIGNGVGLSSRQQPGGENKLKEENSSTNNKESYKSIPEDNLEPKNNKLETTSPPIIEVKMVQGNDGADEQMLGKKEEVKFIKGDHQNGDAKIDIGAVGKTFTGMSKDELMKYANDPFWVRIRWIFFILFWITWVGMLVLSILIIFNAPKCSAPTPLKWYQQGPFAFYRSVDEVSPADVAIAKKIYATGVIYKLPAEETYSVKDPKVEEKIKKLIDTYKSTPEVQVILDITPNYVTKDSPLLVDALSDETKRSAFIWMEKAEKPNNWLSTVNGSAWDEIQPGNFVLSQFGTGLYDLRMNDTLVKKELKSSLQHLMSLGVKGFRLNNSKYFLINPTFEDEEASEKNTYIHTEYGFWTHARTTFQEGLGELLYEYRVAVKNVSMEAFLSVTDDTIYPEVYRTNAGEFGIDLPVYGRFPHVLSAPEGKDLFAELENIVKTVGKTTWLQWNYEVSGEVDPSAYSLFMSMLSGVPIIPANSAAVNLSAATLQHINHIRTSASYMHGDFDMYRSGDIIAYSRIKSGNPGYIVAFNPSEEVATANFTGVGLPEKMTMDIFSDNFNVTGIELKGKILTNSVVLSPRSTAIYTYVPVK
ncbi:uncharacterized protein LOC129915603 [Episyrphus balteatus]|uniref:uncharacterized protein LOC129915603 n=1 Tax=Episyrphus balteatus TaxID=286459 RepID=UPI002485CB33|nr:uncharacterized protein LOC129915603 [Episyrphus balteatus]